MSASKPDRAGQGSKGRAAILWTLLPLLGACGPDEVPQTSEDSPVVTPLGAEQPKTVDGLFDAAVLLLEMERPGLAHSYLKDLLALDPRDRDLIAIRERHGSEVLERLARTPSLNPESVTLLEQINRAFANLGEQSIRQLQGSKDQSHR